GGLKLMEQGGGLGQPSCGQVGDSEKVAGFEIVLEIYRSLQLLDGIVGVTLEHVDSTQEAQRARVPRFFGHNRLQQCLRLSNFSFAEPGASRIQLSFEIIWLERQRGVKIGSSLICLSQ